MKKPTLFLDRDGIVNLDAGYVYQRSAFVWVSGITKLIRRANDLGYWVIIVTNQSGIGRGYYTETDMFTLHKWMIAELREAEANVDAIYHCPFHDDARRLSYRRDSYNRKPQPGMLYRAMVDYPIAPQNSILIGDKESDIIAAQSAAISAHLFSGGDIYEFGRGLLK